MNFRDALFLVQIILAVTLIAIILLQAKGSITGLFGDSSSQVYRTRRGLELRMFQFTIVLSAAFFVVALVNSLKF